MTNALAALKDPHPDRRDVAVDEPGDLPRRTRLDQETACLLVGRMVRLVLDERTRALNQPFLTHPDASVQGEARLALDAISGSGGDD